MSTVKFTPTEWEAMRLVSAATETRGQIRADKHNQCYQWTSAGARVWTKPVHVRFDWQPVVLSLCQTLQSHGYTINEIDDGEEVHRIAPGTPHEQGTSAAEIVCSVDESTIRIKDPAGKGYRLFIVLGNAPSEIVCDHSADDELSALVSKHSESWENRDCPTIIEPR